MICSKCGTQNDATAKFCGKCGQALQVVQQPVPNVDVQQNNINSGTQIINQNINGGVYKLTLIRQKSYVGSLIKFKIYLDNNMVGTIKNGETVVLDVPAGNHMISFNKSMNQNINIMGDTSADVVVIAGNKFGISTVRDRNGAVIQDNNLTQANIEGLEKSAKNTILYGGICILVTFLLLITINMVVSPWIYGAILGLSIVNITATKKSTQIPEDRLKKIKNLNTISIVISVVGMIISELLIIG